MEPLRTARLTGLWYLGLAVTGAFGYLIGRPLLFEAGNASATLDNLVEQTAFARVWVGFELGIVVTQALTAAWFYRLFRGVDPVGAAGIAAFGLVNAITALGSSALLATAVDIAHEPFGGEAATVQTLFLVSDHLWAAGNVFFGLWLIPMGGCVLRSRWMPRPLGWILVGGGVGYVVNAFVSLVAPGAELIGGLLVLPATIGEFWMLGYLLIRGVRRTDSAHQHADSIAAPA